jgi:hypothetical protein
LFCPHIVSFDNRISNSPALQRFFPIAILSSTILSRNTTNKELRKNHDNNFRIAHQEQAPNAADILLMMTPAFFQKRQYRVLPHPLKRRIPGSPGIVIDIALVSHLSEDDQTYHSTVLKFRHLHRCPFVIK